MLFRVAAENQPSIIFIGEGCCTLALQCCPSLIWCGLNFQQVLEIHLGEIPGTRHNLLLICSGQPLRASPASSSWVRL